jgi:cellulose synthase/poly-beta-1,6-N-acetylglucosamine synthase-like glycosyltransferase
MDEVAFWLSFVIFVYFVFYAGTTFALICRSLYDTLLAAGERGRLFTPPERLRRPGISLIAPAYNMEPIIVGCTRSLLSADYDPLEVVIVDDGSEDGTTAALIAAFDLVELPVGDRTKIPTRPVLRYFVSRSDHRLRVLQKENGGRSDAINAGLNVAHRELVALVDADTLLERDALKRIGEVFAADPDDVVAAGGNVRIANGAVIENDAVTVPHVARGGWEASQTGEYLRSFLGARIAWSSFNGLAIISGAFGVFRRDLIRDGGGLSLDTLGEDMELVLRLHHQLRPHQPGTRVVHAPDANAWTEIPDSLAPLRGQRIRWHVGLLDNLRIHRTMIGRRRFGAVGVWSLPHAVLFEAAGPLIQAAGMVLLAVLVGLRQVNWPYAVALFVVMLLVGQLQTAGAILIEEVGFRRYAVRDLMVIAGWSLAEVVWFRPLTALWRLWATLLVLVGRRPGWGTIPRGAAFKELPEPELAPAPAPLPR